MSGTDARTATRSFEVEREGETVIMTPLGALPKLDCQESQAWADDVARGLLNDVRAHNIVVDLHRARNFGGTALGLFLRLWKKARDRDGRMVLCNVSRDASGMLHATGLDCVWPIHPTREKALEAVKR